LYKINVLINRLTAVIINNIKNNNDEI